MGVTAGLIRYCARSSIRLRPRIPSTFQTIKNYSSAFLIAAGDELHPAFKTFGRPLSLTLNGDYTYEGGLDAFGRDELNDSDHYLAFVSPPLVKEIAANLWCSSI